MAYLDERIAISRSADRQGETVPKAKISPLNKKIAALHQDLPRLTGLNTLIMQTEDNPLEITGKISWKTLREPSGPSLPANLGGSSSPPS